MNRPLALALYTLNQRRCGKKQVKQENERYVKGPNDNLFKHLLSQHKEKPAIIAHEFKPQ